MQTNELPRELRALVHASVGLLGRVIRRELGEVKFAFIEELRADMTETRASDEEETFARLEIHLAKLRALKDRERLEVARAFTLMLELMNACENAYRAFRLRARGPVPFDSSLGPAPEAVIFVLTAHPTEARSPQNIAVFHELQMLLIEILEAEDPRAFDERLLHWLEIAWHAPVVRGRKPRVRDEAEHIYSLLLRDRVLFNLIAERPFPFYVRSWVGGDKDGHPGVDEKAMTQSLTLSRRALRRVAQRELDTVRATLELTDARGLGKKLQALERGLRALAQLRPGDAREVKRFRETLRQLSVDYRRIFAELHPALARLDRLTRVFPGLVVPLELRESSDVLMNFSPGLAIHRMLTTLARFAKGGNPRWYARGFIVSMTKEAAHIHAACKIQRAVFGELPLPVIPLFEDGRSLDESPRIVREILSAPGLKRAAQKRWDGLFEIMVGYSDSAKEGGVLASRLEIARALPKLEAACARAGLTAVFFHGSGGSVDRGGGSIDDQTSWWPKAALNRYKVTVQGEMIERTLASPSIARRHVERIGESLARGLKAGGSREASNPTLEKFAAAVSEAYRQTIASPDFLALVETATPYSFLNALKIGSRPSKRAKQISVSGLRAIPWVLCWTQTRLLFPTWWGIGQAWAALDAREKAELRRAFDQDPVFTSYVKALGFTLAKVELGVWRVYLGAAGHGAAFASFAREFQAARAAYAAICGHDKLMWFRPWLGESIQLRSAMIHPLNLLQILAMESRDPELLRVTVTGISSGMMTTG